MLEVVCIIGVGAGVTEGCKDQDQEWNGEQRSVEDFFHEFE